MSEESQSQGSSNLAENSRAGQWIKKVNWFKIILYLSIGFLCYSLYKADYLEIPKVFSYGHLAISFCLLFFGFVVMCQTWRAVLKYDTGVNVSLTDSIISDGLSIFAKYIPGKFMVIIGRALYVSKAYDAPMNKVSFGSLKAELLSIWTGLVIGLFAIFSIDFDDKFSLVGIIFVIGFSLVLFSNKTKTLFLSLIKKILRKNLDYTTVTAKSIPKILPSFFLNWLVWCLSFYFFSAALVEDPSTISLTSGLSFAVAAALAILAIVTPGGIGVREGLLSLCLIQFGVEESSAITISIASRLWFLVGEAFLFLLALTLKQFKTQSE